MLLLLVRLRRNETYDGFLELGDAAEGGGAIGAEKGEVRRTLAIGEVARGGRGIRGGDIVRGSGIKDA